MSCLWDVEAGFLDLRVFSHALFRSFSLKKSQEFGGKNVMKS